MNFDKHDPAISIVKIGIAGIVLVSAVIGYRAYTLYGTQLLEQPVHTCEHEEPTHDTTNNEATFDSVVAKEIFENCLDAVALRNRNADGYVVDACSDAGTDLGKHATNHNLDEYRKLFAKCARQSTNDVADLIKQCDVAAYKLSEIQ